MRYRVVLTEAAWSDLLDIGLYIRRHNPERAESFIAELYDRCSGLGDMPEAYPLIVDPKARGVRRVVHGHYLLLFRIHGTVVEILHVCHGARDYGRLLFPDDER